MATYADRVEGIGVAGTPAGGVLSVQGVAGGVGMTVTVSGTVAVTQSGAWAVTVSGTVAATQSGAWSVSITGTPTVDTELPPASAFSDTLAPANSPTVQAIIVARTTGAATYELPRSGGDDTATVAAGSLGRLIVASRKYGFGARANAWERWVTEDGYGFGEHPVDLSVTVVGGANAIATATLPAAPSLFHYITHISIRRITTAALAGGGVLSITTTNLNGRSWRTGNVHSITVDIPDGAVLIDQEYVHPIKSDTVNTNTTIVCPAAGAAVSWHIVVDYFTAG